jgi:hypothetical protein
VRREDIGLALVQAAIIEVGRGDYSAALGPLQLATHPGVGALSPSDLFLALQYQFQVETQLGRTLEALATHARIAAGYDPDDYDPYEFRADELADAMEDEEYLPVYGDIEQRPWHIDLARRYFYIDDIVGRIDTLTAECDTSRQVLDFEPQADYNIPQAFGACTVFVSGDPGTTFTFVEVRVEN